MYFYILAESCPEPSVRYGSLESCNSTVNTNCQVKCEAGYEASVPTVTCKGDGTWSRDLNTVCQSETYTKYNQEHVLRILTIYLI